MSNTANWPFAVSGTKACQAILGLVKTRGHLIMLWRAIGWNLRVCLLWLTGVESSIPLFVDSTQVSSSVCHWWWWWCRASCPWMSVGILGTNCECDQCLSMVQCCFTSTEIITHMVIRLIRTESPGRPPRLLFCWTLSATEIWIWFYTLQGPLPQYW